MAQAHLKHVGDFLDVPDNELAACLNAFRLFVLRTKADRRAAEMEGLPHDSIPMESFCWNPRDHLENQNIPPEGTTPLEDLPLRHSVRETLRTMNVFCLEDLSEVTEREFHAMRDVGALTVEKIRALLASVGLAFKPPADPEARLREKNRVARKVAPSARLASITDDSSVAELGLTASTFNRAHRRQHTTVGALRSLTVRGLAFDYGNTQGREILDTLKRAGLTLHQAPIQTDLWHYGFISAGQLVLPTNPLAPLQDYSPWIGNALVRRLQERGVGTIPQLAAILESGAAKAIPGIGTKTQRKLLSFLARLEASQVTGDRCPRLHEKPASAKRRAASSNTGRTSTWLEAVPDSKPEDRFKESTPSHGENA